MRNAVLLSLLLLTIPVMSAVAAPLKPNSGLWWEEPVTGRFYAVEIAPSGKTFVVVSEFDEQGHTVWRSMRGDLQLSTEQEQREGAPLASLTAPLQDLDGACPTCPPSTPNVQPSALGEASIVFTTHATAEFHQGAIHRPLRYFAPADQPQDFPATRLAGTYTFALGQSTSAGARLALLEEARGPACARFEGAMPAADAVRLSGNCAAGLCDAANGGLQLSQLELAVGPGEHPVINAYQRTLAPEARVNPSCHFTYPGFLIDCSCSTGFTLTRDPQTGARTCLNNSGPWVCTETHRVSEQYGVIRGLPLRASDSAFSLFPIVE